MFKIQKCYWKYVVNPWCAKFNGNDTKQVANETISLSSTTAKKKKNRTTLKKSYKFIMQNHAV